MASFVWKKVQNETIFLYNFHYLVLLNKIILIVFWTHAKRLVFNWPIDSYYAF